MAAAQDQRVSTRATGVVGIAILCSRVLGLVREMVIAALFGATRNMDAFLTAFRAPNMLRDLFAEGALSTAFVTTFSRRIATEGERSAWDLASKVATLALRSEEHTSELQSQSNLVCRLLLEKKKQPAPAC